MKPLQIPPGSQFGRLVVIGTAPSRQKRQVLRCRCECGASVAVTATHLKSGNTTSCGCFRREDAAARHTTHGGRDRPEYTIWRNMLARCERGENYAGRGIAVCERWQKFENFFSDMGPRPSEKHSIERKNNNGGYEPDNCCWATRAIQNRNKRNNILVVLGQTTIILKDAAALAGLPYTTVYRRYRSGWPIERALS